MQIILDEVKKEGTNTSSQNRSKVNDWLNNWVGEGRDNKVKSWLENWISNKV